MFPIKSSGDEPLETLLNRATNPANAEEDWLSINGFCDRLNEEVEGPLIAVKLLAHKVQSPQEKEALYALTVLEKCVQNCGQRFHQEIGKFRFLNEIIKVISPKYLGQYTSPKVKEKCIVLLYGWSQGLPGELKIKEAYQMLKTQGIIKHDPSGAQVEKIINARPGATPEPRPAGIFGNNDEKSKQLARLLRSRNQTDLAAANRMIKAMVKEDNDRVERLSKRLSELETVRNNTKLLSEMLEHYKRNGGASEDTEIMRELYQTLDAARPNLVRLARETDESDNDGITEILQVNDAALEVIKRCHDYQIPLARPEPQGEAALPGASPPPLPPADSDLLGLQHDGPPPYSEDDLLSRDLAALGLNATSTPATATTANATATANGNALVHEARAEPKLDSELLSDLFCAPPSNHAAARAPEVSLANLSPAHRPEGQQQQQQQQQAKVPTAFDDLSSLGKEWVEQQRRAQPPTKPLVLEKNEPLVDVTSTTPRYAPIGDLLSEKLRVDLSLLDLPISEVRPDASKLPTTLLEKPGGLRLQVHFTENRPALNVRAFVFVINSTLPQPVSSIALRLEPLSEGLRIDLKPASDSNLAAFNPFAPQVAVTQIVLTETNCEMDPVELKYQLEFSVAGSRQVEEGETGNLNT